MTKCASCRVRHLNCDTSPTCTECKKNGRDCLRLNVRFRHLVCPSQRATPADYSKYEFFFDNEQTWTDINGNLEFVVENDSSASVSPMDELDQISDVIGVNTEPRPALLEQPFPTFELGSTSHTPTIHASVLGDDLSDYMPVFEQASSGPPGKDYLGDASAMPAHSLREASQPGEKLPSDTSVSHLRRVLPVQSLQEGKLLQHFVTHLAPWVCTNVFLVL